MFQVPQNIKRGTSKSKLLEKYKTYGTKDKGNKIQFLNSNEAKFRKKIGLQNSANY